GTEKDYYRILASQDNTFVEWTGGVSGNITLNAGEVHDFSTTADFIVSSDKPVLLGQFLASQNAGANTGDPAMMLVAPNEQLRNDYIFLVPPNYNYNRLTVVAKTGTEVVLNSTTYDPSLFTNIPGTDWHRLWIDITAGSHKLQATAPVGLYVYGFSDYVSYAYIAGLDLNIINFACWDLNENGICDPWEDVNLDGICNDRDCKQ
ncbi:MAG TPA: IgGFc-binding protein, partial [bacterium]|nr:IgGFc-binding protein [bacterium]